MIFLVLSVLTNMAMAFLFGQIVEASSSRNIEGFNKFFIGTIMLLVIHPFILWTFNVLRKRFVYEMSRDLKGRIFNSLMDRDMLSYYKEDTGNKISTLTNDMNILENDYFERYIMLIHSVLLFILAIISIFKISYQMGLFLVFASAISMLLPRLLGKNLQKYQKDYSDAQSEYTSRISEYFQGYDTIKTFGIIKKIQNQFAENSQLVTHSGIIYTKKLNYVKVFSVFLGGITFMGAFLFGGYLVTLNVITIGSMIICIQLSNHITQPVYVIVEQMSSLKSVKEILHKVDGIIDFKNLEIEKIENAYELEKFKNKINMDSVYFSYNDENPIIKKFNCDFERDKKYAIVGKSGSGKSTIINLLSRKLKPIQGNIYIDNIPIERLKESSILNLVSLIEQKVFLFNDTFRQNVALFNNYDDNEIINALQQAGLEKFIKNIDDESFASENGIFLSGGERQRIAIARALIRKSPIILADEAFSNLDNKTAFEVEKSLLKLNNVTVISVTHRLIPDNLKLYDEIIVLNEGEIVERGHFDDLSKNDSYFKNILDVCEIYE